MSSTVPKILERLFNKKKDWDYCNISIAGRGPISIEPTTKFSFNDGLLTISDNEAPNPFYQGMKDEPKYVSLEAYVDVDLISSVEFLNFPKIISKPTKIIT